MSRRLGLRARLIAQAQARTLSVADVRRVVRDVTLFSRRSPCTAGVFHAISAFNNAGCGLHPDSLVRYVDDPWVMLTIAAAVILGGLRFPVVFELARTWRRPRIWSVTARITIITTVALLAVSTVAFVVIERDHPATLGPLPPGPSCWPGSSPGSPAGNQREALAVALLDHHGRILRRVGAHHVVYPEFEMGERVAHLVSGQLLDYMQVDDDIERLVGLS